MPFIIIGALIAVVVMQAIFVQRKLAVMGENINNAMKQIGVQLSSRFEILTAFMGVIKKYDANEYHLLAEMMKFRYRDITEMSTPDDVTAQEENFSEVRSRISGTAERYPALIADKEYIKCMDALECYEKMLRTSCLIYNDSVTAFNRVLHKFPGALLARALGFRQKAYLNVFGTMKDMSGMEYKEIVQ